MLLNQDDRKLQIPSIEEINKAINNFETEIWSNNNLAEVEKYITKLDDYFTSKLGLVFTTARISNTDKLPDKVYRVRKFDESIIETLISEFSTTPVNLTKLGRANLPFHPAFYCSPSAWTALYEMLQLTFQNKDDDNNYYLSEWIFKKDQPAYITPFFYGEYDKIDIFNEWSEKAIVDFIKDIPDLNRDEIFRLKKILNLFSKLFEKNEHYISAYLAHKHLYKQNNMRTDIFIYPSIQANKESLNFAIHPNAVIHKMQLKRIFQFKVNNFYYKDEKYWFDFSTYNKVGLNNDHGYLIWRNLSEQDSMDFEKLFTPVNF